MKKEILCGSSCVKYILEETNMKKKPINSQMTWVSQLAIALKNNGYSNTKIYCYDSSLYKDYLKLKNKSEFIGFKYLDKAIKNNIPIENKELNKSVLKDEIINSLYMILCVESSLFNNDDSMSGGHYIILKEYKNNKVKIINPIKDKYEEKWVDLDFLIYVCKNYGSWRIVLEV